MGSPQMAVPCLNALLESGMAVVGVVSQPDRPAGRGQEMRSPPVAQLAKERGLSLLQPERIKGNDDFLKSLKAWAPDLIVVVAYGRILPSEILTLPPQKCINVHFSLLPQYRGAAPIQWALINGESETGVTTFYLVESVDAGPILLQKKIPIEEEDNAEILGNRAAQAGAHLLLETLKGLKECFLEPKLQNDRLATYAPPLKKEEGRLDWTKRAKALAAQVKGMNPWPGTWTFWQGKLLKIHRTQWEEGHRKGRPGEVVMVHADGIEVMCGKGSLVLREVQLEGSRKMSAEDFLRGHPLQLGENFGEKNG